MPASDEASVGGGRRVHPYLSGNFAPLQSTQPLTPCPYTGQLPDELVGGEYVRNGGNPLSNEELGRDAHWFDGDGMLSGVLFRRTEKDQVQPEYVNQYILTDVFLSTKTSPHLRTPILPSIATLVNPLSSLFTILLRIFRTLVLVLLSHLSGSRQGIKKISVANTAVLYHDGRALATCESGPPMRIALPSLQTIGWYTGEASEGESDHVTETGPVIGGTGVFSFFREWTTAHPRVDPLTQEFLLYHSCFVPPYVQYSVIPSRQTGRKMASDTAQTLLNRAVPGISSPKLMHDFGVAHSHTIIMDLPLSLDPLNLAKNKPTVAYDPRSRARFGIFPRYEPEQVRWFETNACCIFHTANSWTSRRKPKGNNSTDDEVTVYMLACRLTSASLVYSAGDIAAPVPVDTIPADAQEEEQCRLYFYEFDLSGSKNTILQQWALTAIPFEFPTLRNDVSMREAQFVYGCSSSNSSFGAALGRAVKIDALVKVDAKNLISAGKKNPPEQIRGCVDTRSTKEVLATSDPHDPIQVFEMPEGWYAQECRFVPRKGSTTEDDGWLLTYVFDESQLDEAGECPPGARSELWVIDALRMKDVVAKVLLPQRVPYGLHGNWFSEVEILTQRPYNRTRQLDVTGHARLKDAASTGNPGLGIPSSLWMKIREEIERYLQ